MANAAGAADDALGGVRGYKQSVAGISATTALPHKLAELERSLAISSGRDERPRADQPDSLRANPRAFPNGVGDFRRDAVSSIFVVSTHVHRAGGVER